MKYSAPLDEFQCNDNVLIHPENTEKTILTIFAGREPSLNILCKYLKKALDLKIINEVHIWNNTRNDSDEKYIKSISNLKRSSSAESNAYTLISPEIINNTFELNVCASNDIHIKITNANANTEYEIVLGGWSNTKSVIRVNNYEICSLNKNNVADGTCKHKYTVSISNNVLNVNKDQDVIFSQKIIDGFEIKDVYFKTGYGSVGDLSYKTTRNHGFYLMDTCEKSWKNYYTHYTNIDYENSVILKCDDDIVFIDLLKLPKFIEFVKNSNYDLVFANTINNGTSAYFQQNTFNLIPKELMKFEYLRNGFGSLWESGKKAEKLHNYFIQNYLSFLNYDYKDKVIDIDTRFSINFFGYKGKNWHKICDCYPNDDEHNLTVNCVLHRNFKNVLYADFYVSHLSFFKQLDELNYSDLIEKYNQFYLENTKRFDSIKTF